MADSAHSWKAIDPFDHERLLAAAVERICALPSPDRKAIAAVLREFPKNGRGFFSSADLMAGYRAFARERRFALSEEEFAARIRRKPVRTLSGVAPVTVLTAPHPCPGSCIFCPAELGMPKSYIASEPGAQRAEQSRFDPFVQAWNRIASLHNLGHNVDKIELLVLGGTFSAYPLAYQVWFVRRLFQALNQVAEAGFKELEAPEAIAMPEARPEAVVEREWARLAKAQALNEEAACRAVGLVLETRPDCVNPAEVVRLRRLGATKVQIGVQSLDDRVLALNRRGHTLAETRLAVGRLRRAGFKIHLHWMPNLKGSTPAADCADFDRLFSDPAFRPDELKVYPCSLIAGTELMRDYQAGRWNPYTQKELLQVIGHALLKTPEYCRLSRVIRDIPGQEIVAGSRITNLRQLVTEDLARHGLHGKDIRAREIRGGRVEPERMRRACVRYSVATGEECFLQWVGPGNRLLAFLRLSLPKPIATAAAADPAIGKSGAVGVISAPAELAGRTALIREVHVYGAVAGLGGSSEAEGPLDPAPGDAALPTHAQHIGLGRSLIDWAIGLARAAGYERLSVISAVGTRAYYRRLGFGDGLLYQHLPLREKERAGGARSEREGAKVRRR